MSEWENRLVGQEMRDPRTLTPNPRNWRKHPKLQGDALGGAISQIGWVAPITYNVRTSHVVDGHLRLELALRRGEDMVPVNLVDLSQEEENVAIATLDPISAMATENETMLKDLLSDIDVEDDALQKMLDDLAKNAGIDDPEKELQQGKIDKIMELMNAWGVEDGDILVIWSEKRQDNDTVRYVPAPRQSVDTAPFPGDKAWKQPSPEPPDDRKEPSF
jgi:hypothetical protein